MVICQTGKPEPGVTPPSMNQDAECAAQFLEYIYLDNCLELFFPLGLDLDPVLPITTTAHPLKNVSSNYGFERFEKYSGITKVKEVNVSPQYLLLNDDIIVARPIDGYECDYSQYNVNDFTEFLNN